MLRSLHRVVLAVGVAVVGACGKGEDGGGAPADTSALAEPAQVPAEPTGVSATEIAAGVVKATAEGPGVGGGGGGGGTGGAMFHMDVIPCDRSGPVRAEVKTVTGPAAAVLTVPDVKHQLKIKAGTVPAGQTHVYLLSEVAGDSTGCQVIAEKLQGGPIVAADDAFTFRIRCSGHGLTNCPSTFVFWKKRVEDGSGWAVEKKADGPGADSFVTLDRSELSTYGLAIPGGPGGTTTPPPGGGNR